MFNTVLFDLDGTLVNLDIEFFLHRYVEALAPRFHHLVPPKVFVRELFRWSQAMVENEDPDLTNLEVFWRGFPAAVGVKRDVLEPIFNDFYAHDFPRLQPPGAKNPAARRLIENLLEKGYTVVIATNPIFPRMAILERLRWTDCADFPYAYITCGEEMHFCKPNLAFFHEVLAKIGRRPAECLMVGNDMEEDMIAQKLGFFTAFVTDLPIDRGEARLNPDWRGRLAELAEVFATDGETSLFCPRVGRP
ncbi:MAG: HAD family hydrolase [Firmicutes bacterium]|nr:HAD family hydrolase [Bacillota bacterium]